MIRILSHRGMWKEEQEKNTLNSIKRALACGYGFESDIRDYNGKLVISHNIADENCALAEDVFAKLNEFKDKYCFAINVKADGLITLLAELLNKYKITNYFTFDMSVPQMLEYKESGITFFTRKSEYEDEPILYASAKGVWIDAFENDEWIDEKLLNKYIADGKEVCIVSPDLHGKEMRSFWKRLKSFELDWNKVMLCTDHPEEATEYWKMGE